jgi:zeaxanthin glucosyltransferase
MPAEGRKWHFGVLSFSGTGHLNPLLSLSQKLKERGHKVTFFEKPKIESRVLQAGLEFFRIEANKSSSESKKSPPKGSGVWSDISRLRSNLKRINHELQIFLVETPPALLQREVNALIIDEIALTGPTVAEILRLPYFIISTSVPHNFGWNDLPGISGRWVSHSPFSWVEDAFLEISALRMRGPIRRSLDDYRRHAGLGPVREMQQAFPALAQITQLPQCLDLPRAILPGNFYYTGPFASSGARPFIEFPWGRLDGRPIIYASLGTTRNVQPSVFHLIAEACNDLGLQLVISLGGRFEPDQFAHLPGKPLVTRYAPQIELMKLAKLVITHGGSNTVFEALMEGKPMITIPLAHDQPAVAARLARLNIAEVLPVMRLSAKRLRVAVTKLLNDPRYRDAAQEAQRRIRSIHGSERAVEIIEEALEKWADGREPARRLRATDSSVAHALR